MAFVFRQGKVVTPGRGGRGAEKEKKYYSLSSLRGKFLKRRRKREREKR
jgi:hypothetical protein